MSDLQGQSVAQTASQVSNGDYNYVNKSAHDSAWGYGDDPLIGVSDWHAGNNWITGTLDYSRELQKLGYENAYNAMEAAKSRDWQEYMSNTAFQRQVKDMQTAGLNPFLAYGGSGAATGSGVSAHSGSGAVPRSGEAVGSLVKGIISVAAQLALGMNSTATQLAVASGKNNTALEVAHMYTDKPPANSRPIGFGRW